MWIVQNTAQVYCQAQNSCDSALDGAHVAIGLFKNY